MQCQVILWTMAKYLSYLDRFARHTPFLIKSYAKQDTKQWSGLQRSIVNCCNNIQLHDPFSLFLQVSRGYTLSTVMNLHILLYPTHIHTHTSCTWHPYTFTLCINTAVSIMTVSPHYTSTLMGMNRNVWTCPIIIGLIDLFWECVTDLIEIVNDEECSYKK